MITFVQATYIMATFVHISNISRSWQGQGKAKVRSRQEQGNVRVRSRKGQDKVKARSRQGQGKVRARSGKDQNKVKARSGKDPGKVIKTRSSRRNYAGSMSFFSFCNDNGMISFELTCVVYV